MTIIPATTQIFCPLISPHPGISLQKISAMGLRFSRSRNTEEMDAFNERLKAIGAKVKGALPVSIASHGIGGKNLKRSIRNTYYYDFGEIYRLGFSFVREGIFLHK
ncbi:MAG: hypothetical protein WCP32_06150 [Bacteroidota bacterium]